MAFQPQCSPTEDDYVSCMCWTCKDLCSRRHRVGPLMTFDMLPNDVLLEIFEFYVHVDENMDMFEKRIVERWITLPHVCRRWRSLVFKSPHCLNLQLFCTNKTRARETRDIWPHLPLVISHYGSLVDWEPSGVDNIIAALEHNDRVCRIALEYVSNSVFECARNLAAIQKPFPELTRLFIGQSSPSDGLIIPDSFLGGTAPRLQDLGLRNVQFLGLPKLLLSTTHLTRLNLFNIPRSGYVPPDVLATSLSALTSLESLWLVFQHPSPRPALGSRHLPLPPLTRSVLPNLTKIEFKGDSEYLEVILARIDAPQLDDFLIEFFNQIVFNTPQLFQFISRTPSLSALETGQIEFYFKATFIKFVQTSGSALHVEIQCSVSEWQLSSLEQICTSFLPPVSTLQDLHIDKNSSSLLSWQDDVENALWLDLLRPFVFVKNLYISKEFVSRMAPALQELVGARTTDVLPNLENIFLKSFLPQKPLDASVEKFVAARQLTNRPVTVSSW